MSGPAVGYTSYYLANGAPCNNCGTGHRGACPPARLLQRLETAAPEQRAHEVEAYVQARLHVEREELARYFRRRAVRPAVV